MKKEKAKIGRPTKYLDTFPGDLLKHFQNAPLWFEMEVQKATASGDVVTITERIPGKMPTVESWCIKQDITTDTYWEWVHRYPEFSGAHYKCKAIQKDFLLFHAMPGRFNANFAKFVATNMTDLQEKVVHQVDPNANTFKLSYNLDE